MSRVVLSLTYTVFPNLLVTTATDLLTSRTRSLFIVKHSCLVVFYTILYYRPTRVHNILVYYTGLPEYIKY